MVTVEQMEAIVHDETSYTGLHVESSGDSVVVVGYWDDLSPEPERTEVQHALEYVRQECEFNRPFEVTEKRFYGSQKLYVSES